MPETDPKAPSPPQRVGWRTSEFFLSVLGALIGCALCFHSKESMNEFGVFLIATSIGTYSLGRGISKITVPNPPS
jgi:hypothetical protein